MTRSTTAMDSKTQSNVALWLKGDFDEQTKKEIVRLQKENPEELIDAFYTNLSFGTGGLRGIMGVGTNRMNIYTVRAATQGLANYINQQRSKTKHSVLVTYDTRHHSWEFATETARVLAANGIEVFLTKEYRPVPFISFGVHCKKCIAGVMITASHNPPKYNGYKVYWSDGAQVLPPHDGGIIGEVDKITSPSQIKIVPFPHPLIHETGGDIETAYLEAVKILQHYPDENRKYGGQLGIIYTPLYGTGITLVPPALEEWGFTHLHYIEEQRFPDGNFPTVKSPNPEDPATLALGIDKLMRTDTALLIATDPDADRLGIVVKHREKPIILDGNQTACIAVEHICRALKEGHLFPDKPMFVKSIVTSELFRAIVESYHATCLDVLTGFKYIGEKISQWEEEKKAGVATYHFIFGAEESYGALLGTHARDKDAVVYSALICEAALHQKLQGKTLIDLLYEIYHKYGVYREKLLSLTYEGKEGAEKIHHMMEKLRKNPPSAIDGIKITSMEDFLSRTALHLEDGRKEPITLPKSDVLRFWLKDDTKIVVRPSGTEPKIKIYCATMSRESSRAVDAAIAKCDERAETYLKSLRKILES